MALQKQPLLKFQSNLYYGFGLVVLAFLLYANTIPNEYAIDDPMVTNNSETQKGIRAIPGIFTSRYRVIEDYNYGYRPVAKATFAIEYQIFGGNVHISHLINVLIYALIAVLLFWLLRKLFRNHHVYFPLFITALFIAHPVHTEVVASLKNREELLSFLCSLLALYFSIRYVEKKNIWNVLPALIFFGFGYLSKQNTIAYLLIIPLTIYFFTVKERLQARTFQDSKRVQQSVNKLMRFQQVSTDSILVILGVLCVTLGIGIEKKWPVYLAAIPFFLFGLRSVSNEKGYRWKQAFHPWMLTGWMALVCAIYLRHEHVILECVVAYFFAAASFFTFRAFNHNALRNQLQLRFDVLQSAISNRIPRITMNVPEGFNQLFGVALVLGLAGLLLWYLPDQFLPPEQRGLHYFENPLIFINDTAQNIATGLYTLLVYLKLLIFPHPLVFYYGYDHIPVVNFSNGWVVISLVIHLSLLIFAIATFKKKHMLSFAIWYYLIAVFMFSNFVIKIPGIVGERLLFMPSLGFCIAIVFIIFKIIKINPKSMVMSKKAKLKLTIALSILLIPYSVKTIARNANWKNHLTLYLHDIPYLENSLHANALVASHLLREIKPHPENQREVKENQKNLALVIKHFKQVLKLDPEDGPALNNLGLIYYDFYKDYATAVQYFERAAKIDSTSAETMFNIGYCYGQFGNLMSAKNAYLKAIQNQDNHIKAISNLANVYFKLGIKDSALAFNDILVEIDTKLDLPYINVGSYYLQMGNEEKAVEMFEKAVELNPGNTDLCKNLSDYFTRLGKYGKADYYAKLSAANY